MVWVEKLGDYKVSVSIRSFSTNAYEELLVFWEDNPGSGHKRFSVTDHIKLYENGFGGPAYIVSANVDGKKIGHAAFYVRTGSSGTRVALLSDLYVHREHRNILAVGQIYNAVAKALKKSNIDVVYTIPNERAEVFAKKYLGLKHHTSIYINFGFYPWFFIKSKNAVDLTNTFLANKMVIKEQFFKNEDFWTAERLRDRINTQHVKYFVHEVDDRLIVSRCIQQYQLSVALICGVFGRSMTDRDVQLVGSEIARIHRTPFYGLLGDKKRMFLPLIKLVQKVNHNNLDEAVINTFQLLDYDIV